MPIPATPGRADIAKIARGDASALEQLYLWMDAVSLVLAQNGLGQEPVAASAGGTVAWPPNEQPATSASGVVAVAVRFADGTFGYIDINALAPSPFLDGFVRKNYNNVGNGTGLTIITDSSDTQPTFVVDNTGSSDGAQINSIGGTGLRVSNANSDTPVLSVSSTAAAPPRWHAHFGNATFTWDFADDYLYVGSSYSPDGSGDTIKLVPNNVPTGDSTLYLPDFGSSFVATLAVIDHAQTWTAAQTFSDNWIASKRAIYTANTQTITAVTDTVDPNVSPSIRLTKATAGNITFTSLPTVLDGAVDEQEIVIQVDESSSANFVFTRDASLSGSGLFLGAATRTVQPGGALVLRWNADRDGWEEISFITTTT